jgi:hypothetical protein
MARICIRVYPETLHPPGWRHRKAVSCPLMVGPSDTAAYLFFPASRLGNPDAGGTLRDVPRSCFAGVAGASGKSIHANGKGDLVPRIASRIIGFRWHGRCGGRGNARPRIDGRRHLMQSAATSPYKGSG